MSEAKRSFAKWMRALFLRLILRVECGWCGARKSGLWLPPFLRKWQPTSDGICAGCCEKHFAGYFPAKKTASGRLAVLNQEIVR